MLSPDHCLTQDGLRGAEVRAHVPMKARELARHLGVSRATAYRIIERLAGTQHQAEALRLATTDVLLGKGAKRQCVAVLWPVESP
ncbi:MAG: hypothetical protein JWM10_4063 [Myxococcaceae bacterium]|nr:hypothetical protein [Myxococcaceae bacterium]